MTTSELITDYKNKLALKLVNTDGLVEAMGNDDIEEPDEAIYTYIFPYFHIPDTIEAAHSYICFKVNMTYCVGYCEPGADENEGPWWCNTS